MPLVVNSNIASLNAQRQLFDSTNSLERSFERLSSGKRINSAADDAAGLAISDRLTSKINGLNQAVRNANDGISVVQIAEGALGEATNILQRMREIAVQAANDSLSEGDRDSLSNEVAALGEALDGAAAAAKFGDVSLLDGTFTGKNFQIGADDGDRLSIAIGQVDSAVLGVDGLTIDSTAVVADFDAAITSIDSALSAIQSERAALGSTQQRLESTIRNLSNVSENSAAARSRILDTDFAAETAQLTRNQILQQAATSILSQANAAPQNVLSLLQ